MLVESAFWQDLESDLADPEFMREYVTESIRIATTDVIINQLDGAREAAGLSKAALARAINTEPASMRRLFDGRQSNPTLGTLAEVAAALGMRVTLEPLKSAERKHTTQPLLSGQTADAASLARYLGAMRGLTTVP
jgi:DNA-binding phage protein